MTRRHAAGRLFALLIGASLLAVTVPALPAAGVSDFLSVEQKLTASVGAPNAYFGFSTAMTDDTAVVGAIGAGAAYVFGRSGDTWSQAQKLTPTGSAYGFGDAVAISGDTIVVGASWTDSNTGAAFVFVRSGGTWTQQQRLTAGDGAAEDMFGTSVAIEGDTLVVGASGTSAMTGAAYVFTRSAGVWTQQKKLTAGDGAAQDWFGTSVAIHDTTILVSAYGRASGASLDVGAVYEFELGAGGWTEDEMLLPPSISGNLNFGMTIAMSGETAIVGAAGTAAHVFTSSSGSWAHQQTLHQSDPGFSWYGWSVALAGNTAVVGGFSHPHGAGPATGAAWVYTRSGSVWSEQKELLPSDGAADDHFGSAVACTSTRVLVGSHWAHTVAGDKAGASYLYSSPPVPKNQIRIAGPNRYLTSIEVSKRGFPVSAPEVVIATGANWPDALGGSALAGAIGGPLLLTRPDALSAELLAEIDRLGATKAYVLGSTGAVSSGVENALVAKFGRANVVRLGGTNRYETARKIADETIARLGGTYTGDAFVATGKNFPDATAAAPLAAALGRPILLANPDTNAVYLPPATWRAVILGGTSAVPAKVEADLKGLLGSTKVLRFGGGNRYATAALIAQLGVDLGMQWEGLGLATGLNFPDALSGGAMLGAQDSVLLLTRPDLLSAESQAKIAANKSGINTMFVFGGTGAVSATVATQARTAAGW